MKWGKEIYPLASGAAAGHRACCLSGFVFEEDKCFFVTHLQSHYFSVEKQQQPVQPKVKLRQRCPSSGIPVLLGISNEKKH